MQKVKKCGKIIPESFLKMQFSILHLSFLCRDVVHYPKNTDKDGLQPGRTIIFVRPGRRTGIRLRRCGTMKKDCGNQERMTRGMKRYLVLVLIVFTLLLLVPHLVWQYEHDWASFAYHLSGRNSVFRPGYVVEFLANVLVVFNPFFVPLYVQAWRKVKPQTPVGRALKLLPVAFIVLFVLSSLRGYVQPQWGIVSCFGLVCVLCAYARRHPRTRRYVMRAGGVTVGLIVLVRLVMIFNPLGIRFEVFNNPESYAAIAAEADGRPVVFRYGYAVAAKYAFYTGGEAYCQPNIRYRTHQWQFRDDDSQFIGREVLVECPDGTVSDSTRQVRTLTMANGRSFTWFVDPAFHPVRLVDIAFTGLPGRVAAGETLRLELRIRNPYPYAIRVGADDTQLVMLWKHGRFRVDEFPTGETFTIPADSELTRGVTFTVLPQLAGETFDVGFALRREGYTNWFNGKSVPTEVGNL